VEEAHVLYLLYLLAPICETFQGGQGITMNTTIFFISSSFYSFLFDKRWGLPTLPPLHRGESN